MHVDFKPIPKTNATQSKGTKPRNWKFVITIQLEFDTKSRN